VLTAETPAEALGQAQAHAAELQLLITDVIMPEMNGRDLAKLICDNKPGLKCLFTSGYTADVIAHHAVLDKASISSEAVFPERIGDQGASGLGMGIEAQSQKRFSKRRFSHIWPERRVMVKTAPWPGVDSTLISPLCSMIICWQMARPRHCLFSWW